MRRLALLAVTAVAVLLPACDGGGNPTVTPGGSSTIPGSSTGLASSVPPDSTAGGRPPLNTPAREPRSHLTAVRVGPRALGDRVVFEFDTVVPGYSIDFVDRPVTEDGSGREVAVKGAAILQVRMENASSARLDGEKVVVTYTGPKRITTSGASVVTEAVQVGDFEGVLNWVIGLSRKPSTISLVTLSEPARLVLDLPATG